jgi:hypothetical protein
VKRLVILGVIGVLAGCQQQVPDSGQGVGFNDYAQYELDRAQREAALTGVPATTGSFVGSAPIGATTLPATPGAIPSSDLAAAGIGAQALGAPLNATALNVPGTAVPTAPGQPDLNRTTGIQASPGNAAPVLLNNPGIRCRVGPRNH